MIKQLKIPDFLFIYNWEKLKKTILYKNESIFYTTPVFEQIGTNLVT